MERLRHNAAWLLAPVLVGCTFSNNIGGPIDAPPEVFVEVGQEMMGTLRVAGPSGFWKFNDGSGSMVLDSAPPPTGFNPMHLTISNTGAVAWVAGGLQITGATTITSAASPHSGHEIDTTTGGSGQMTVEVWVTLANTTQGLDPPEGPTLPDFATIFLASGSIVSHSAMIAQVGETFTGRSRTNTMPTQDEDNAGLPEIKSPMGTAHTFGPIHVALVTDNNRRILYVNGTPYSSSPTGIAPLSWDRSYSLRFGDAFPGYDRQWHGTLWMAAIYKRALDENEINQNLTAGYACSEC